MDDEGSGVIGDFEATDDQIRRAWEEAAVAAMEQHRRTGVPVATWDWENGRVALIPADEIQHPGEHPIVVPMAPDHAV